MTFPNIKVAVGQQDRTAIKGKVIARFPAQVWGANGIKVSKAAGAYTIANDWGALNTATSISEPARTWLAVYLSASGESSEEYRRIAWGAFVSEMIRGQAAGFGTGLNGGGQVLETGYAGFVVVPFACEIQSVTALSPEVGSIVVDVWRSTYAAFPPVDGGSITGAAPISISGASKSQDTTLSGWSKTLGSGDILLFNIDSVENIINVNISFVVKRL